MHEIGKTLARLGDGAELRFAAGVVAGWHGALYWLIPAVIASVYLSIGYAWIFAIEIPRRRQ